MVSFPHQKKKTPQNLPNYYLYIIHLKPNNTKLLKQIWHNIKMIEACLAILILERKSKSVTHTHLYTVNNFIHLLKTFKWNKLHKLKTHFPKQQKTDEP